MRRHVDELLEEYLAGELSLKEQREIREHLHGCPSCERAMAEAQNSRSYLAWLVPEEAPPVPGPGFYLRVERAIERKAESSWFAQLTRSLHPRLAYPLLLLVLLSAAWTLTVEVDADDDALFAFPPTQFSTTVDTEADQLDLRDLVMASLVEVTEED
ncbi:MAG: anti-sigma factor family protein [Terriglobia bacterium]